MALALTALVCGPAASSNVDPSVDVNPSSEYCVKRSRSLRSYINRGAPWAALDFAERCAALPGVPDAQRAAALYNLAGIRALVGDSAGAERDLRRALELEPGDADASLRLAQTLRDRPQEALRFAEQVALSSATTGRRAYAHRLAAEIKLDLDDASGAQRSFEKALELSGQDLDAMLGLIRVLRGRPQEASVYALRIAHAAETAPLWYRPAAYRLSARAWLELKDYPQAMASARRAFDLYPDDRDTLRTMLQIKQEQPRVSRMWLGLKSLFGPRWTVRHEVDSAPGMDGGDPEDLETLRKLIALKRERGERNEAVALTDQFVEAIEESPDWQRPSAYRLAARIWLELGDRSKASQCILQAQGLDWQSVESALLAVEIETGENKRQLLQVLSQAYQSTALEHERLGQDALSKKDTELKERYFEQSQSPAR